MIECNQAPHLNDILTKSPNIKGLLFDMDGTLLQSEFVHAYALQRVLLRYNENVPTVEQLEKNYVGVCDTDVIEELKLLKLLPSDVETNELIKLKNKLFISSIRDFKKEDYISKEILSLLGNAKKNNLKLAIVTASESEVTHALVKYLGLNDYFDLIITAGDCKNTKPHADPYLKALKDLDLESTDVVILEDSYTGLEAAIKTRPAQIYKACWY